MDLREFLWLVPALPLAGFLALVLAWPWADGLARRLRGGRGLPPIWAGWLATALVGAAFALSLGIGLQFLRAESGDDASAASAEAGGHAAGTGATPAGSAAAPAPFVQRLWTWMDVGRDQVEVTAARVELPAVKEIPEGAVGSAWVDLETARQLNPKALRILRQSRDRMLRPEAAAGMRPLGATIDAGGLVTVDNVRPDEGQAAADITVAQPRTRHRFVVDMALQLDGLSLLMLLVITGVGFLIHLYSIGYMGHDDGIRRYFSYLNLFVFSMLMLVLGANFLVLFVGWELVGACSYLLIGFWHEDPANAAAGRKAFVVNRVGDFAFIIALMLIWSVFGSLDFARVFGQAESLLPLGGALAVAIPVLLLVGATGKSAQVPLYVWLPDAMAGPTPVSALIHAATMVTAGVYMSARAHALFDRAPVVLTAMAVVGALTALIAALIATVQADIKRVLAYSTISQLGFMFMGVGAGTAVAGVFHLMTHAFFKALLFLGAGSLMHAMEHGFEHAHAHPQPTDGIPAPQDMRLMGGLLKRAPITGWTFLVGGLALAGFPGLAGFWSKDEIVHALHHRSAAEPLFLLLWLMALLTAFLTAYYTGRQLCLALFGPPRSAGAAEAAESPWVMTLPLVLLALLSVVGWLPGNPLAAHSLLARHVLPVVGGEHGVIDAEGALTATAVALAGLALAWAAFGPGRRLVDVDRLAGRFAFARRLAWNRFYVDELYDRLFVSPFKRLADFFWRVVDVGMVDGLVNWLGRLTVGAGQLLRGWQSGQLRGYALSMLLGALVLAWYLFSQVWGG